MNIFVLSIIIIVYLLIIGYLGYLGYRGTKTSGDYMVAGRQIHPYIMAISYGATFISTSAIVGFGGTAGVFGLGLLWLTFLNIALGIAVAFIFFGKRTRRMGHNLDAHTFPELLGRRYNSKFIQVLGGVVIFVFMPLYTGVVLIGAARFIESTLNVNFVLALMVFSIIIAAYVIAGGLKGVMYTDALQGTIMFVGMIALLVLTYIKTPHGFIGTHQLLTDLASKVPENLVAGGHQGWTTMPALGSPLWWSLVSTIVLGVGIGVLAQPQLAIRFMTVKSNKELNRAVLVGGIFILAMTGIAFVIGALSNVYFNEELGKISVAVAEGNTDLIMPTFINMAMPKWFVYVFMVTLLAAAMSTISSQFHVIGTSFSRDMLGIGNVPNNSDAAAEQVRPTKGVLLTKIGIIIGIVISIVLGYYLPVSIIARGTSLFFGVCAATFLPMFICGLFWKGSTKAGAISGMVVGIVSSVFWMFFVHKANAEMLKLVIVLTGKPSIFDYPWNAVDPIVIAFPLAFIVTIIVSLFTKKMPKEIIDKSFK
ncbi:MAG: sodium:solute symporter family protein [Actinobacteria bacterium]|nr:sodium:solute symporter family protein [Actinomycetota bacterium]